MECVAYLRVSTDRQVEDGYGLDSQKRDIVEYCKKNNLIISKWYIDAGLSGMEMTKRVELQRLISDINNINRVVVYKLDRLARDSVDALYMIEKIFTPKGIQVISVHDFAKYETPQDKFQTHIMAAVAEYDRNTMLLRMRGGMLERVKQGYWMGGGNLPYCYSYSKEKGILIPISERKIKANEALDLYLQGYSDEKIQHLLGFKTEKTVTNILTSVVNIGKIPYKDNVYQGLHEAIFDVNKFEMAQKLREQRKEKKAYSLTDANLLTGLCYCGVCGCAMRYQKWTHGQHKIYCCSRNKKMSYLPNYDMNCDNTLEWAKDIESQVEEQIKQIALNIDNVIQENKTNNIDILQKQLDEVTNKTKRLYNLYAEGNDMVVDMITELEKQRESINKQLQEEIARDNKKNNKELKKQIKKIADVWDNIDKKDKNTILKSIIHKIIVDNGDIEIQIKNY